MQTTVLGLSPTDSSDGPINNAAIETAASVYENAERSFEHLLLTDELDQKILHQPSLTRNFQAVLELALEDSFSEEPMDELAMLFLQRILYRINRLNLFWYDDLQNYCNERSLYLAEVRDRIEIAWQEWELSQIDTAALQQEDVREGLIRRSDVDLEPPLSPEARFIREEMSEEGYRHLLAIASFDGLVEASRLSRILGGAANEVQCTLVRVLLEEYGNGRLPRKHSTFFAQMMAEMGLNTAPEGYFKIVPWEVLASINHNFLLTERKRYFLRYNGGLTYFEVAGPAVYRNYLAAAQRLHLSDSAMGYWDLHIREDERHGRWMLEEVALPLAEQYPGNAWEILLGYEQEKLMSERAGAAIVRSIRQQEGTV
jgi:hypothetical protein